MTARTARPESSVPPMKIPARWLDHLRTDRRGISVPWVNVCGAEGDVPTVVRWDRNVGRDAVFFDDEGQTVPDFTRQSIQRQREAMVAGLCQVCARPVPWSRRFLVLAPLSVDHIDLGGRQVPVVTEPWLDERCAHIATTRCPALIRRTREDDLRVRQVRRADCQLVLSTGWVEGPFEAQTRQQPAVMWAKLALPGLLAMAVTPG